MQPFVELQNQGVKRYRGVTHRAGDVDRRPEVRAREVGGEPLRVLRVWCTADRRIEGCAPISARDLEAMAEQAAELVEPAREPAQVRDQLGRRRVLDAAFAGGVGMTEPRQREVAG